MTKLYYHARNINNLNNLADQTKAKAMQWYKYCEANNINVLIYETIRSIEKQRENMKNGASQTLQSYHITGQALDFVPVDAKGNTLWGGYHATDIQKAIKYAKSLGFEWGGDWSSFVDSPHLQYVGRGYGKDTFGQKPIPLDIPKTTKKKYNSLVDYLKDHKQNSSFPARAILAKKYGIKNYSGTAEQNIKLLNKLQA